MQHPTQKNLGALEERIQRNPYPGRGLIIGRSRSGHNYVQIYWVMGRSSASQDRILVASDELVQTVPYKNEDMDQASLTIYTAMRKVHDEHIVSNGDHTDTIARFIEEGRTFEDAVFAREHEPDPPHYTPRIAGVLSLGKVTLVRLAKIFRDYHNAGQSCYAFYVYPSLAPGFGICLHTYQGDGDPLLYYAEDPFMVTLGDSIDEIADYYWGLLDQKNRVALAVKLVDMNSGRTEYRVINRHKP